MDTSIELKKRELAELKKKSDKLKVEIKVYDEQMGLKLDLTCVEFMPLNSQVLIKPNVTGELFIAKTEIKRMARFFNVLAEKNV